MPDRYTAKEASAVLNVTPARVNQLIKKVGLTVERIGGADFFSPAQIKQMRKWLDEYGRKRGAK